MTRHDSRSSSGFASAKGSVVTITAEGRRGDVVVEVHDFGPAIPEKELRSIFDPLARRETTTKRASLD